MGQPKKPMAQRDRAKINASREHKTCGTSARCILDDFSNRGKRKHGQIHKSMAVDAAQVINGRVESDGGNCGTDSVLLERHVSGLSKRTRARTAKVWDKCLQSALLMSAMAGDYCGTSGILEWHSWRSEPGSAGPFGQYGGRFCVISGQPATSFSCPGGSPAPGAPGAAWLLGQPATSNDKVLALQYQKGFVHNRAPTVVF